MNQLNIDIETYSSVNLAKAGVYKYAESEDFEILLFAYSVDDGQTQIVDLAQGEVIPEEILVALQDEDITKWAFNANFERICLSRYLGVKYLSPESWRCTMVWSAYLGLPLSLETVGKVLGLDKQKLSEGKDLIRYFCVPCTPTKANGRRTRNLPHHALDKWEQFKTYNIRDVDTEREIQEKLAKFPVPDFVWKEYQLDQAINDRGIKVDMEFVAQAIKLDSVIRNQLMLDMQQITRLDNPNSIQQLKGWLEKQGVETENLGKQAVKELVNTTQGEVAEALSIRLKLAKSSIKKYQAMVDVAGSDHRCRGMFQFLGANRTGRFSGRNIQLQNLPRNYLPELDSVRALVKEGDHQTMTLLYDDVPDVLSQLIRTAFIPKECCRFFVADFSAIEARVIAWLAKEKWREELFQQGGDIYCMSASQMFGVPVEKHGVNSELRQKGKIAELACIAEDELVLTDYGLIPIQHVTTDMKVWDGLNWVNHDGVIYKGVKEVIEYDGLKATPNHLVWVEGRPFPISFEEASEYGLWLEQTGMEETTLQYGQLRHTFLNKSYGIPSGKTRVYDIRNAGPYHRFTVSGKLVHNCGYGGSVGALKAMGALSMGLDEEELQPLVTAWRASNPNITALWWAVDTAVKECIQKGMTTKTHGIQFTYQSGMLRITLPSGRQLTYVKPRIELNKFGGESVTYEGIGTTKKWERIESYGPKFVENIVQAISRDILVVAMQGLSERYDIVAHVHDEVIIEAPASTSLDEICRDMSRAQIWAQGLVLNADGYVCDFYKKD